MAGNKMNKNPLSGTGNVFRFTLKQICFGKGWLLSTIILGALMLLGIPLLLFAISVVSDPNKEADDDKAKISHVLVCDETEGEADYSILKDAGYSDADYTAYASMDEAIAAITDMDSTIILRVTKPEDSFLLTVYLPEDSALSRAQANTFGNAMAARFSAVLMQKAQLTPEAVQLLSLPIMSSAQAMQPDSDEPEKETNLVEEVLQMFMPFLTIMLLYMMVILYGQSMANSVMLEKTSKLMETILTAVNPIALMTGKLFASAAAAVIQIMIWLFCGIGGCIGGVFFALKMIPDTENNVVLTMNEVIINHSMFSVSGILLGLVIIALGFLLYLSLGAVAGALSAKAEDLNKTNSIFVLVLVISFICCLGGSDIDSGSMISSAAWLRYFPFTALLVNPGELLLGKLGMGTAFVSILLLLLAVAMFIAAAAAIYKLLVLYRGNVPTPKALLAMLRQNKPKKK